MFFADGVAKFFGARDVLRDVSFVVSDGERAGLVGPNGAGKSTILKLLARELEPDAGHAGSRGGRLGYLHQETGLASEETLVTEMWRAYPDALAIELELEQVARSIEQAGDGALDALIERQARLFDDFDAVDGYRIEARIGRVLDGLGFSTEDRARPCGDFSGGWQMRVALAQALVRRPPNLLLDEPTNHLDGAARDWLAGELSEYPGALLIVTHDGDFLDQVAGRILDLRDGAVESYTGNYSSYQRQKADKLQAQDRAAARQERELARQERFIERFRAKATKATAVQSRERQISKIERISRTRKEAAVSFSLEATGRTERDVLVCSGVSHAYGENLVLLGVDLHVERSQKVVLVGPNGSGKSTLLKIAAGDLPPSEGEVEWAGRAIRAYYDQHQDEALDPDRTVLEEVAAAAPGQPEGRLRSHVERSQKVVLVGPNGSGKSTLLKIAAGDLPPSEGDVEWAGRAIRAYYDQHQDEALDPDRTVLEEVAAAAPGQPEGRLRSTLGQFLFRGDAVFKRVAVLSGGERSRVALAKLLLKPANVLLLDEPTNHLDRTTRRKLIEALERYDGTLLCASHDPAIVERVATRVYEVSDLGVREVLEHRRD